MHIEFLLEEESAKAALNILLPKLLPADTTWACFPHRGKTDLFQRLPGRLKTYARQLPHQPELRVVILMDADTDCRRRKAELEKIVADGGLLTKTSSWSWPALPHINPFGRTRIGSLVSRRPGRLFRRHTRGYARNISVA